MRKKDDSSWTPVQTSSGCLPCYGPVERQNSIVGGQKAEERATGQVTTTKDVLQWPTSLIQRLSPEVSPTSQ